VPVQHSRAFLGSIKDVLPKDVPIICVSKGLEVGTGCMMSEVIPSALGRRQPAVFLSGPSFAKEVRSVGGWGAGGGGRPGGTKEGLQCSAEGGGRCLDFAVVVPMVTWKQHVGDVSIKRGWC